MKLCICGNEALAAGACAECLEDMDKVADILDRPANPRHRGDDDGVEYADPSDELAERRKR